MLSRLGSALLVLCFPAVLLGLGVRAAMSRTFLAFEYGRPGFPEDVYGFSREDRMLYGSYGLEYIQNDADPRYLGDLVFTRGGSVFTDGEVSHMTDVKHVLGLGLDVTLWLGVLMLVLALLLRRRPGAVRAGLRGGVALTALGILAAGIAAAVNWQGFFAWVHSLFFSEGTWTFYADSTLIRLYPEQFWMDAALLVAAVIVAVCAAVLIVTRRASRSAR